MDRPVVSAGFVAAGVGAIGALLPWGGARDPIAVALGALAFAGFAAARYDLLDARSGAGIGAAGGVALACYALVLGSGQGAIVAGAGGIGAALAAAVRGGSATERAEALVEAVLVGGGGYLVLAVWVTLLQSALLAAGVEVTPLVENVRNGAATLLGALTVAAAFLGATERGRAYVDLPRPGKRDALAFLGGVVGVVTVAFGYSALFGALGVETAEHSLADSVAGNPELLVVLIPSSLLFVGPGEELLYRNLVQKRLAEDFPDVTAIAVASAVFSAVHLTAYIGGGGSVGAALLSVFTLSVILGAAYAYSESLLVAAAVHGCYDAVVFAAIALGVG
jgi:membrane protease YdiL (CAAX protease family)